MKATTMQERMDLLQEVNEAARSAMEEWCRRWNAGPNGDGEPIHLIWQEDGTAVVEVDDLPALRVQVEISTSAVEYEDAKPPTNEPTGFIFTRTWAEVPAGWFVQGPGTPGRNIPAPWFEVVATRHEDGKQWVSLRVNGTVGEWPRDPAATVRVKKGTLARERDTALDVLTEAFGSVQVLADGGQFS